MASVTCTDLKYKYFNGGWSGWSSTLHEGYAGNKNYVVALSFKVPSVSGLYTNTKLAVTIPFVRQSTAAKSGHLYLKLSSSDPTGDKGTTSKTIPTESTCDAKLAWSASDLDMHTTSGTIEKTITPGKTYYILIGCSSNYLEIGYSDKYNDLYSIKLNYTNYTAVGKGSITITDHYNNTFSISGTKGADGTNNAASGPVISWGYTNSYSTSGAVSKKALAIATASDATRTVYAKCVTNAEYGSSTTATTSKAIKQYVAPGVPGTPTISYNRSRLTVKEPWTFSWTASKAINTSSPVAGYRIRLYKNDKLVTGITAGTDNTLTLTSGATNNFLDRDGTSTTVTFDPLDFGFKAGDTVKLGLHSYTKYGASNTGDKLFDSAAAEKVSSVYTVQNAGVVNSKVGGAWKEGQVYVKVAGAWKEAETVNTKISGAWKESK